VTFLEPSGGGQGGLGRSDRSQLGEAIFRTSPMDFHRTASASENDYMSRDESGITAQDAAPQQFLVLVAGCTLRLRRMDCDQPQPSHSRRRSRIGGARTAQLAAPGPIVAPARIGKELLRSASWSTTLRPIGPNHGELTCRPAPKRATIYFDVFGTDAKGVHLSHAGDILIELSDKLAGTKIEGSINSLCGLFSSRARWP